MNGKIGENHRQENGQVLQPKREDNNQNEDHTVQEDQLNYFNEYCRLYLANAVLSTQLKELNTEKHDLLNKLSKLEKKADEISQGQSQNQQKRRRVRRSASQIARHYKCCVETCSKSYGSEGSLNQHIKIKHPEAFKALGVSYASSNNLTLKESQEGEEYEH